MAKAFLKRDVPVKKLIFASSLVLLACAFAFAQDGLSGVGFTEEALSPATDFKSYAGLYIYGIDVRGMVVKITDTDGDTYERSAPDDILSNIALDLGKAFSAEIGNVLPVVEQEEEIDGAKELKGKNALILDIKLSYDRATEDVGTLTHVLLRKEQSVSGKGLTIECVFRDADSNKPVLKLTQTQAFDVENNDQPFAGEKDQEALGKLIELWSSRAARILASKREAQ